MHRMVPTCTWLPVAVAAVLALLEDCLLQPDGDGDRRVEAFVVVAADGVAKGVEAL